MTVDKSKKKINFEKILTTELVNHLEIVFQPIYSLSKKKNVAYEILSRFCKEELKTLSTLEIIEILEKIEQIHILDFLILEKSKKYLNKKDLKICINLSPKTIVREDFLEKFNFSKNELKNLEIEITERGELNYTELMYKFLKLKELGIKVVMDDFPIGGSNLENLLKTYINTVKIDRGLIKYLSSDKGKIIYKSIVRFLKELGSEITAEGVETIEELEFIRSIDVDLVQGYYIGKPIGEEEFIKL
ncbi:EAL domain-containing protein [Cetobacterium sp. 2G large]|uniref:EAL domain-containing protein n=1 Tax=Cetobacterium sp. 2G large TaxID=2759680 RepID=UPI00163C795E|nr:EAL domain-containing protein [Cetobacterium sp. 2G large]